MEHNSAIVSKIVKSNEYWYIASPGFSSDTPHHHPTHKLTGLVPYVKYEILAVWICVSQTVNGTLQVQDGTTQPCPPYGHVDKNLIFIGKGL